MGKIFSFSLPEELNQRLAILSDKRTGESSNRITKAWLMREALTHYLNKAEKEQDGQNA